jgi:hypothetical protein
LAILRALAWDVVSRKLSTFMTAIFVVGIAGYGVQHVGRGVLGGYINSTP